MQVAPGALANIVSALSPAGLTPVYDDDFLIAAEPVSGSNIVPLTPGAFRRGGMMAIPRSEAELPLLLEMTPGPPDRDSSGLDFVDLNDFPAEEVAARLQDAATYLKLGCADGVPLRLATSPACRIVDGVGASSSHPLVATHRRVHAMVGPRSSAPYQQSHPASSHSPQLLTPSLTASRSTAALTCSGEATAGLGPGAGAAAAVATVATVTTVATAVPESAPAALSCSIATGFNVKKLTAFRDKVLRNVAPAVVSGYMEMARPVQEARRRRRLALLTAQRARIAAAAAGAAAARDGGAATAAASSAAAAMAAASSMAAAIANAFGAGSGAGGSTGSCLPQPGAAVGSPGTSSCQGVPVDIAVSGATVRRFASRSGGSSPPPVMPSASAARAALVTRPALMTEALAAAPREKPTAPREAQLDDAGGVSAVGTSISTSSSGGLASGARGGARAVAASSTAPQTRSSSGGGDVQQGRSSSSAAAGRWWCRRRRCSREVAGALRAAGRRLAGAGVPAYPWV